ncbi:MAG: hypothetical protein Q9160_000658 [Pyrenula sp. 1 TL-2023]
MSRTSLDLIKECDNFPWTVHDDDDQAKVNIKDYWSFKVADSDTTLGYMAPWVVKQMSWSNDWDVQEAAKHVILRPASRSPLSKREIRDLAVESQLKEAKKKGAFKVLNGWRNELYPVYGTKRTIELNMERAGSALFGIVTYGVHMVCYVNAGDALRIWVPRRARTKSTYPGMMDNTVAGGISTGEEPLACLVREAEEEASLPADFVRKHAKACGTVSYFHIRDARAGGETGLCQPECQYVYDLELPDSMIPKPDDNEAEDFRLLSIAQVQVAMAAGEFKPNCALVLIDFFVRHGILAPEIEKDYTEIVARLHRSLPFPMA